MQAALTVILVTAALAAAWALWLLAHPIGPCRRCRGRCVAKQMFTGRLIPCPRCDGAGLTRRVGATAVHRTYWSIRDDQTRRERLAALEQQARANETEQKS